MGSIIEIPIPRPGFRLLRNPHWPQPPSSDLDTTDGLRERKSFADKMRTRHRDISPRLLAYILDLGEKCQSLLKGRLRTHQAKKEELATVKINDAMLRSTWETEESKEGLWQGIFDVLDAFTEHRMTADYGDYLAISLDSYRGADLQWTGIIWTEIAELIEIEEEALYRFENSRPQPDTAPQTPMLDDCTKVATKKGLSTGQVIFEIKEYARRNTQCHSGVRNLINRAKWQELAELMMRDKQRLREVYRQHPLEQQRMRDCINEIQKEWFDMVFIEDNGHVNWVASDKNRQKTMKLLKQRQQQREQRRRPAGAWNPELLDPQTGAGLGVVLPAGGKTRIGELMDSMMGF